MGTHLICIDESMQFKWVTTTYPFMKEVDKKYTGCNLKTMGLLDCTLFGVCAVIRLNTVSGYNHLEPCLCEEICKKVSTFLLKKIKNK